jgi:hypothetical protein
VEASGDVGRGKKDVKDASPGGLLRRGSGDIKQALFDPVFGPMRLYCAWIVRFRQLMRHRFKGFGARSGSIKTIPQGSGQVRTEELKQCNWADWWERVVGVAYGAPAGTEAVAVGFDDFGCLAVVQTCVLGGVGEEHPGAFVNFITFPKPNVVDVAKGLNVAQSDTEFFLDLSPDRLFGTFVGFETATGRPMIDAAGMRVCDFSGEKCVIATEDAKGGLAGSDLHWVHDFNAL